MPLTWKARERSQHWESTVRLGTCLCCHSRCWAGFTWHAVSTTFPSAFFHSTPGKQQLLGPRHLPARGLVTGFWPMSYVKGCLQKGLPFLNKKTESYKEKGLRPPISFLSGQIWDAAISPQVQHSGIRTLEHPGPPSSPGLLTPEAPVTQNRPMWPPKPLGYDFPYVETQS